MTGPAPEPATETWTYGGVRVGKGGKRLHAWLDADGVELLFSRVGARMAVGSQYTVRVLRQDGIITLHGTPGYAGSAVDEATRRAVWAEHTVAQTRLEMIRAERSAARSSALDEALAPLWSWLPRCAPAPSGMPSPPMSSASSTTPGFRSDLRGLRGASASRRPAP
jgi:hypothetical protein